MLPFPYVMDLLPDKFSGLHAGRFALSRILPGAPDSFLVGHFSSLSNTFSPPEFRQKHCDKPIRKKQ